MKKIYFTITALIVTLIMATSCYKETFHLLVDVVVDNQSSSQVSGALIGESESDGFNLAPGESHLYSFVTDSDSRSLDPSFSIGPRKLVVDGKTYILKSTSKANDFFDLYGWDIEINSTGLHHVYKVTLTDEGIARLIANADLI